MSDTKTAPVAVATPTAMETNPLSLPRETQQANTDLAVTPAPAPAPLPPYADIKSPSGPGGEVNVNEKAHPVTLDPNQQDPEKSASGHPEGVQDPRCMPIEAANLDPIFVKCHFCGFEGLTRVELENGNRSM